MEISIRDKVVYSLWLVPLVLPFSMALWDLIPFLQYLPRSSDPSLHWVLGCDADLVRVGFLVPTAFFIAWRLTRQRVDLTSFFVVLTADVALTCGFSLVNSFQRHNYALAVFGFLAICAGIIVSVVFALLRRKRVVARAVLYRSSEQREARRQKELGMGYAQIMPRQKVLYSLWLLPLLASLLVVLIFIGDIFYNFAFTNDFHFSGAGNEYRIAEPILGHIVRVIGFLVVIGYMLGWLTSREHEERTSFVVLAFSYIVLTVLTMVLAATAPMLRLWGIYDAVCVIGLAWVIASCIWAMMRRKEIVGRSVLHRSSQQRELRKLADRQLLASEKAATTSSRRQGKERAGVWARSKKRAAEVPSTVPVQETKGTPGSALSAVVGPDRSASAKEAEVAPTPIAPASAGDAPLQPMESVGAAAKAAGLSAPPAGEQHIDANSCTAIELLALPGMTATMAKSIVAKREEGGPYASVEQLVARNNLKPHEVAPFLLKLTVSTPSAERVGTHRARLLDL